MYMQKTNKTTDKNPIFTKGCKRYFLLPKGYNMYGFTFLAKNVVDIFG